LQGTRKTLEGAQPPDRDAQFAYLNDQATAYLAAGQPVISVDAKKKDLVGQFANTGVEWPPSGEPVRVNVHDFPDPSWARRSPTASTTWGQHRLGECRG
jgi:Rhodopirellula transposase DDE domain